MKSNTWLVDYCKHQVDRPYWFGTFGTVASASLYKSKCNQYPNQYPPKKFTKESFTKQYGQKVHDCAGLIKGAIWSDSFDDPNPSYKASEDYGANKFFTNATKNGTMDSFIDMPGILVFKGTDKSKSHVGVYIGNGKVIEAKGHSYGVVESSVSGFKYWAQCNLIVYENAAPAPAPDPKPEPKPEPNTYTVKKGDTLWAIARAHKVMLKDLIAANPQIKNPNLIYPGQKITIPIK